MKRIVTLAMVMMVMAVSVAFAGNITLIDESYDIWKKIHPNQKVPFVGYIQYNTKDFNAGKIRLTLMDDAHVRDVLIEGVDRSTLDKFLRSGRPEKIPSLGDNKYYIAFPVSVLTKIQGGSELVFQYMFMNKVE